MKKHIFIVSLMGLLFLHKKVDAQDEKPDKQAITVYTADSLKSGKAKDVLASFFQLGLNNLFGTAKEFNFSANPYELARKSKPDINIDISYRKWTFWRRINLAFGLKLDSSYNYNGLTSGLKIALIDGTDPSTSKNYLQLLQMDTIANETKVLNRKLSDRFIALAKHNTDSTAIDLLTLHQEIESFIHSQTKFVNVKNERLKAWITEIVKEEQLTHVGTVISDPKLTFNSVYAKNIADYKNRLKKASLLTFGVNDTTYKDKFQFSAISSYLEFNKGVFNIGPKKNDFDLNAKASYNFTRDTLKENRNLHRQVFESSLSLNWVVRDKQTDQSFFELALGTGYHYVFNKDLYVGEVQNMFTLNSTVRVRIISDLWLPFEIKYDPVSGKVFGLFNVKLNFSALDNLSKGAK